MAIPLAGIIAGWLGGPALARLHRTVRLVELVRAEEGIPEEERSFEYRAWRPTGESAEALEARAGAVRRRFRIGGALLGLWLGAVAMLRVVAFSRRTLRTEYEVDRARCVSCARCYKYCPRERLRWKELAGGTES
jgi:ferredoxin